MTILNFLHNACVYSNPHLIECLSQTSHESKGIAILITCTHSLIDLEDCHCYLLLVDSALILIHSLACANVCPP